jgi:uncharacterized membrane protein
VSRLFSGYRSSRRFVQSRDDSEIEFARVVAFSDGVIAIAITLLVLNLDVPDVAGGDLADALGDQWRQYLAFALSFALIGRFWLLHHRTFALVERLDGTLMGLNLLFLALIVLMPFATDLVAEYGDEALVVVIYAMVVGLASLLTWAMVRHTVRAGHVRESLRPRAEAFASWHGLGPAAIFLVSAPVALLSPDVALWLWLLSFLPGLRAAVPGPQEGVAGAPDGKDAGDGRPPDPA